MSDSTTGDEPRIEADLSSGVDRRPERSRGLRWFGRVGGPVLALLAFAILPEGADALTTGGRATAAVAVLMAILWMTEAMPLPATSLIPIALFPLTGAATIDEATAPYANKIVFLFVGGFMLALAMQRWQLHRRIAFITILIAGTRPSQVIGGFMVAAAVMSMWVSNTAATIMLLPVGASVVALVTRRLDSDTRVGATDGHGLPPAVAAFATALVLGIAYAASIGSVATPIGTPPNLLLKGFVRDTYGIDIGFGQWMAFGLPLVALMLPVGWWLLTRVLFHPPTERIAGGRDLIRDELDALGPVTRGEWTVFVVFLLAASAWVLREPLVGWDWMVRSLPAIERLDDAGIAIIAALLLFMLPVDARQGVFVMDWATAKQIPWGLILLFGGGLSLAAAIRANGVDAWIGGQVEALGGLPAFPLVVAIVAGIILLTELTSNTATAATFLPVLGGVALGIGVDPLLLVVPAALAASFAFMLPVATPPNAVAFGSGYVTIGQMVRAGIWFNLVALVLIPLVAYLLAAPILGAR